MTRKCINCESGKTMRHFSGETFSVEYAGLKRDVKALSGWRCGSCDEIEFDAKSANRYAASGDELVLRNRREQSAEIRRIRKKLGLSQAEAARLTGGGHNAFSRYEKGEVTPVAAVANLFRLLDRHPKLLKELPAFSPVAKAVSSPDVVNNALNTLKGRARIKRTMWSRRAQEYEAKINSGDLVSIAEVVRDLHRASGQPEQSYSERQLYEAALARMAREVAAVERTDEPTAVKRVEGMLMKKAA
jgi:putative zinc finger/helix-turn-helix YgiT family protein